MRKVTLALMLSVLALSTVPQIVAGDEIHITLDLPGRGDYQVTQTPHGQRLEFKDCGYRLAPGRPMLPTKTFLVALPPETRATLLGVRLAGADEFPGTFRLAAIPEPMPIGGSDASPRKGDAHTRAGFAPGQAQAEAEVCPLDPGWISGSGTLGGYAYVAVTICPCSCDRLSGKLMRYAVAEITVTCEPDPRMVLETSVPIRHWPDVTTRARETFVNFEDVEGLYHTNGRQASSPLQTYDYVIVTTSALAPAVTSSDFVAWKTSLGYSVRIVLITDPEIAGQPGGDLAEQIRNFLRAYYAVWSIEYVLMVGDYATVPMRYCYPDPTNHTNTAGTPGGSGGEVPTDYYYADLSASDALSWDSDGDGYYGEYGEDAPDFMPEVYVGRIPINTSGRITHALNKIVAFEQDTGAWKENALLAGAFWYFTHETSDTSPCHDAAHYLSYIEADIMSGWTVTRYSEQAGLEASAYAWPALTEAAFTGAWRTGQYAVVNMGAHGWTDRIARKVWDWDDGDGRPEANEISWPDIVSTSSDLDDDYPSIVTSASCLVGCPEPNSYGNMGIKMLVIPDWGPAVAVIASARSPYGTAYWPPGGTESIIYEFNDLMITDLEKVGQAFYDSKFYCTTNYGWDHYAEYINMYTFNLWGDPSLTREGIDLAAIEVTESERQTRTALDVTAGPNPARGIVTIEYYLPSPTAPDLEVFDVLGRKVRSIEVGSKAAGWNTAAWDGRDAEGRSVTGGMYWIRLSVPGGAKTVRVLKLR